MFWSLVLIIFVYLYSISMLGITFTIQILNYVYTLYYNYRINVQSEKIWNYFKIIETNAIKN